MSRFIEQQACHDRCSDLSFHSTLASLRIQGGNYQYWIHRLLEDFDTPCHWGIQANESIQIVSTIIDWLVFFQVMLTVPLVFKVLQVNRHTLLLFNRPIKSIANYFSIHILISIGTTGIQVTTFIRATIFMRATISTDSSHQIAVFSSPTQGKSQHRGHQ